MESRFIEILAHQATNKGISLSDVYIRLIVSDLCRVFRI